MSVKIPSFFSNPYSSATNIMSSRDHPFNKSTRPLLMERKPQLLLSKKRSSELSKMHGFNDFDIISQQYRNLSTQHIGYPYGSPPPSPTVISSNDFVFSDTQNNTIYHQTRSPKLTLNNTSILSTPKPYPKSSVDEDNYYSNVNESDKLPSYTNKYTDIYSWRTKSQTQHQQQQNIPQEQVSSKQLMDSINDIDNYSDTNGGPFIFGVHSANNNFVEKQSSVILSNNRKYINKKDKKDVEFNQSISEISSNSKENEKQSKFFFRCLRKSKKRINKENKENRPVIKCVAVGDGTVGKTNLIVSYLENRFIMEHIPTASDIYNAEVMVNDRPVHVILCDTAGQDTLDPLRELSYPDSDVFLLCFSVIKPESFHSIKTKWAPKFAKSKAALILVGTQADLRTDYALLNKLQAQGEKPISFADAWDLAASIGAKYIETSSFTQDKVKDVFDEAIWEALAQNKSRQNRPVWKKFLCFA